MEAVRSALREVKDTHGIAVMHQNHPGVMQLLSYHAAVALGRDVDKPRNLAKSVTVE